MQSDVKDRLYLNEWNGGNKQVSISNGKEEKTIINAYLIKVWEVATVQMCFELLEESIIWEH